MNKITTDDQREIQKMGLETFFMDKKNVFDPAIDGLIKQLKGHVQERRDHIDGWDNLKKNDPERYREMAEQAERYEIDIEHTQIDAWIDISYYEEQLTAVAEMRIIYAYKFLEINIKRLIKASLSPKSVRGFYRWNDLVS